MASTTRWSRSTLVIIGVALAACATGVLVFLLHQAHQRQMARMQRRYEYQIGFLDSRIRSGELKPGPFLEGLEKALALLKDRAVTTVPTVTSATVWQDSRAGQTYLAVAWVEEDTDYTGITIREFNEASGEEVVERYPVFADLSPEWRQEQLVGPWRLMNRLRVTLRADENQRKDEAAWSRWAEAPDDTLPRVWIRPPRTDGWRVTLMVYDATGNVSEPVEVEWSNAHM